MDKLIQQITKTPENTAKIACGFLALESNPKRKRPKIPPLKIEDSAHQPSKVLLIPLNAKPTKMLSRPITSEEILNTQSDNSASLALYEKMGFTVSGEKFPVYCYSVSPSQ